ncbi:hypothetical protein IJ531_03885 [bacterium]|nr:hypothetical protein [bacterium]
MIKKLILLFFILIMPFALASYDPYVPKGTLIKVYTKVPLTTEGLEEGSNVYFNVPSDVWVQEQKAFEAGDIFKGYVSDLKMPVQGVNAAMQVKITDVIKKEGYMEPVSGTLIFGNKDTLGGNLTEPSSYNKSYFPRKVYGSIWGGTYRYVPSGEYEFGKHMVINMRDSLFVQLDEDYYVYE